MAAVEKGVGLRISIVSDSCHYSDLLINISPEVQAKESGVHEGEPASKLIKLSKSEFGV